MDITMPVLIFYLCMEYLFSNSESNAQRVILNFGHLVSQVSLVMNYDNCNAGNIKLAVIVYSTVGLEKNISLVHC